jgi:hypothetical protein
MKITLTILLIVLLKLNMYSQENFNFNEYLSYFKNIQIPFSINQKFMDKIFKIDEDSIENNLGKKIPTKYLKTAFEQVFVIDLDSNEFFNPLFFPIGKFEKDSLILLLIYFKGGAGGYNEEYYLSIYTLDGKFLSTNRIACENGDNGFEYTEESKILIDGEMIKSTRDIEKFENGKTKRIKNQILKYKIDKNNGKLIEMKTKKKKKYNGDINEIYFIFNYSFNFF